MRAAISSSSQSAQACSCSRASTGSKASSTCIPSPLAAARSTIVRASLASSGLAPKPRGRSSGLVLLSTQARAAPKTASSSSTSALPDGEVDVTGDASEKMAKSVQATQESFNSVRTGRANASMLDRVEVDYYGTPTPLKSLAGISAPDASSLTIQPYDLSAMALIEKAIVNCADLGMTPSNDGKQIRLNVPALTADRRKEMAKLVSKLGEEGKVAVRNVRKAAMKIVDAMLKDKAISEDRKKTLDKNIQALTDENVKKVEAMVKAKQDEITKV